MYPNRLGYAKQEIATLMAKVKESDNADLKDLDAPDEIRRRQDRIKNIAKGKATIEARRNERYQREKEDYDKKTAAHELKEKERGRKLGGKKKPAEPENKPKPSDQVNLTDEESRIMPKSGGKLPAGQKNKPVEVGAKGITNPNPQKTSTAGSKSLVSAAFADNLGKGSCLTI